MTNENKFHALSGKTKQAPQQQQPIKLNVDPGTLPDVTCECGNSTFISGIRIKKVSALISPNGQEAYIHIAVPLCAKCFVTLPDRP